MVGELKHIPNQLLNAEKKSKSIFLRALFDDEAGITISDYSIGFGMTLKHVVRKVKEMLKEFGIKPGKIGEKSYKKWKWKTQYRFTITSKQNLEIFKREIGFDHPQKIKDMNTMIQSYKRDLYKRGEIKKLIYKVVKEKKSISIKQLATKLKRKPKGRFYRHLHQLEEKGKIKISKGYVKLNEHARNL